MIHHVLLRSPEERLTAPDAASGSRGDYRTRGWFSGTTVYWGEILAHEQRYEAQQTGHLTENANVLEGGDDPSVCTLGCLRPSCLFHVLVARYSVFTSTFRRPSLPT
jgi:hypothetical protein